jgi:hypothetical protein
MGRPPFTTEQFFEVMRRYNDAVWPAQCGFYLLALIAIAAAWRDTAPRAGRIVSGILAFLWLWVGVVYHLVFFRTINPGATLFGLLFIVQAVLFAWVGVWRGHLAFRPRPDWTGLTGGLLLVYALVIYPALGYAFGQRYPAVPTFGLPCPTTIFTIGLLLWAQRPVQPVAFLIPIAWAALGEQAAVYFGVWEDLGLTVAGVLAVIALLPRPTVSRTAPGQYETGLMTGGPSVNRGFQHERR